MASDDAVQLDRELTGLHGESMPHRRQMIIDRYLRAAMEEGGKAGRLFVDNEWKDWQKRSGTERHILECAEKAVHKLEDDSCVVVMDKFEKLVAIICEAFGCKSKDECETALDTVIQIRKTNQDDVPAFSAGFKAAWKIAKEGK